MNNWPVFDTRYAEEIAVSRPGYWESAVVALILLVIWSILLVFIMQWRRRSQTLLLVSSRPHTLSQPKEYLPPQLFFLLSNLHTAIICGFIIALIINREQNVDAATFWIEAGWSTATFAGLILISTIIYYWLAKTFGRESQRQLWMPNQQLLIYLFGHSLYIPLVVLLFSETSIVIIVGIVAILYLSFRIWNTARLLAIFNQLHRYPLHIFLYLCACEIVPLLFIVNSGILSK